MKLGVVFPQNDVSTDPGAIRAFAQGVEEMGYHHLLILDHVLGADTSERPNWKPFYGTAPPYKLKSLFHEPFVLLGYLASVTRRIGLATGVLILPQRQTAPAGCG